MALSFQAKSFGSAPHLILAVCGYLDRLLDVVASTDVFTSIMQLPLCRRGQ